MDVVTSIQTEIDCIDAHTDITFFHVFVPIFGKDLPEDSRMMIQFKDKYSI
jgi:hypothetical protein